MDSTGVVKDANGNMKAIDNLNTTQTLEYTKDK
jgi:hypothetical protein